MERDSALKFPHITILRASAGSGKTYALARRFVLFLLSPSIPRNRLQNLLAITFSNNAAKEMKERILNLLKQICLGDDNTLSEFEAALSLGGAVLEERAEELIEEILRSYSDFQVKTIDSFMTMVFKASSVDFGYNPDFEILMNNRPTMEHAFSLYLKRVREGTAEGRFMSDVLDAMVANRPGDSSYPWEPTAEILDEIGEIYGRLSASGKPIQIPETDSAVNRITEAIRASVQSLKKVIEASGLTRSRASSYEGIVAAVDGGRFRDLPDKGMKSAPVCKPGKQTDGEAYHNVLEKWAELEKLIATYARTQAMAHYAPYLKVYGSFADILERTKRLEGKVFIEDVNRWLAGYVREDIAPEIYCRLGDVISHYLVDEFQDTSPVQWRSLFPLLENALSEEGSLFVVGDTKQAIYGFRDADYRIMRGIEQRNPFPSAQHSVQELNTNYRSDEKVVAFVEHVFQRILPTRDGYLEAAGESGLLTYSQGVGPARRGRGYVETYLLARDDETSPEKTKLLEIVKDLTERGYGYSDVAVLAFKNDEVIKLTTWLNSAQIPVISYSSLDIRKRRLVGEIIALLEFLDSPVDNLAFATFLLGDTFRSVCGREDGSTTERVRDFCFSNRNAKGRPLYKAFQEEMADLWNHYFDRLFRSSGYLPLYDLLVEIFRVFDSFQSFGDQEEAILVKMLEVAKNLEAKGGSSLRNFLQFAAESPIGDADWNVDVPLDMDAVRVMTVHKAKGLGFPVVVLMLYGERNKGFKYIVDEGRDSVVFLHLTKKTASCDSDFEKLYREEEKKEKVNKLNSLYVGLTRASSELHVIGVKRTKESFPFDLFPDDSRFCSGAPQMTVAARKKTAVLLDTFHYGGQAPVPVGSAGKLNFEERRRGDFIHKVLSMLPYVTENFAEELDNAVEMSCREMGIETGHRDIVDRIKGLLREPQLSPYYEPRPDRTVFLEYELADAAGHLFRLDRMTLDPDRVTVIEYKTGGDGDYQEKHQAQMFNYLTIVSDVFPDRPVEGLIGYVDLAIVKRVA
jgi:ATP-dependent exoDNAse (exonuclease V) beta subunit